MRLILLHFFSLRAYVEQVICSIPISVASVSCLGPPARTQLTSSKAAALSRPFTSSSTLLITLCQRRGTPSDLYTIYSYFSRLTWQVGGHTPWPLELGCARSAVTRVSLGLCSPRLSPNKIACRLQCSSLPASSLLFDFEIAGSNPAGKGLGKS